MQGDTGELAPAEQYRGDVDGDGRLDLFINGTVTQGRNWRQN